MGVLEAVVLGLVQGLTEFLPISSTAHLRIAPELFGWPDPGAAFSAVIQLGTVLAVVVYFRHDVVALLRAWGRSVAHRRPFETVESRLAWFVLIGTVPICVFGLALKKVIEGQFRSLYIISGSLIALAVLLFISEKLASHRRRLNELSWKDGLLIGLWQAVALIPGSSRSGTTLTGGLLLGLTREDAARFSFLLSIPATALAGLFELKHLLEAESRPATLMLVIGTVVAFGSGMAAIAGLLKYLRTRTTQVFVVYRLGLGALLIVLLQLGILQPMSGLENLAPEKTPAKVPVPENVTD